VALGGLARDLVAQVHPKDRCAAIARGGGVETRPDWVPRRASLLLAPEAPLFASKAPEHFHGCFVTSQGPILVESRRKWAPYGVDRFHALVKAGYYDDIRIHRAVADRWAQFGIHGRPQVAQTWRDRTIPDDPPRLSNTKGTLAYAFAEPGGRTTQLFFNLRDNSENLDSEPFVPIARVVWGVRAMDAIYTGYGESAGGGIRGGNQDPLFEGGNAYLDERFPDLDRIYRAVVLR
jgi:cyclophilin family peptidyl-prolyl cis-trans isomerase